MRDLEAFAELSGDYNPMHVDPIAARRTLFGGPVVHGVCALLWGLNELARDLPHDVNGRRQLSGLRAVFLKPIPVDTPIRLDLARPSADEARIRLEVAGRMAATIRVGLTPSGSAAPSQVPDERPERSAPRAPAAEEIAELRGSVSPVLDRKLARELFGELPRGLPDRQVAELLATTYIVGMRCPGLHSIYSALDVSFSNAVDSAPLEYEVRGWDERFSRIDLGLRSPSMHGGLTAFLRPAPRRQVRCADIDQVADGEFAGQRALVIGGSRGLGEVSAKLLAAGSAQVAVTWFRGEEDARRVAGEIRSHGGEAVSLRWDVGADAAQLRDAWSESWTPTHVYYFASPFIESTGAFSPALFAKYCDTYVVGFVNSMQALLDLGCRHLRVLYASTVYAEQPPAGLAEYVAAKRAGEGVCDAWQHAHEHWNVLRPRLPRLATDQTHSLLGEESADPVPVLLAELRRLRDL
jgi:NAD(P)-dependent dehydrogenase (short-subunit alcohol dehydrogenase family)